MELRRALSLVLTVLSGAVAGGAPAQAQTSPVVTAARIAAMRVVTDHHAGPQGMMLRCLALIEPRQAGIAAEDWRGMLAEAGTIMAHANIPAEDIRSLLAPLTVGALTAGSARTAETRESCEASEDWQRRWAAFMAYTFPADVREVLTGRR